MTDGITVELFAGTESFSKVMREVGIECFTVELDQQFTPTLRKDILQLTIDDLPKKKIGMVWASPPCNAFSVLQIGKNWTKTNQPKIDTAILGLKLIRKTIELITQIKPTYWILENPVGKLRKLIDPIFNEYGLRVNSDYVRNTVTYCQYGDFRMKPTDLWINIFTWNPKPMCKNNDKCHTPAPRGSTSGTQGLKGGRTTRAVVPKLLCEEIRDVILDRSERKVFSLEQFMEAVI